MVWSLVASGAFLFDIVTRRHADSEVIRARAASERLNADLQARLESAVVRMSANHGALDQTAAMIERRHAALAQIMTGLNGVDGAVQALAPKPLRADMPPIQRILAVRLDQERLLDRAETFAQTRAERLRLAFRLAGLKMVKTRVQENFPVDLHPVRMYWLVPSTSAPEDEQDA